jgi:catechol 2,3-dioxygenase-like lactoylglutathione lyase family enzyme
MAGDNSNEKLIDGGSPVVYVSDMDRAVAFYTETLGLKLAGRFDDEYALVDAGRGFQIGLHPSGPRSPKPGTPGSIQITLGVHGSIDDVVATLTHRGVSFDGPIIDDDPVRLAFFTDPDGNELHLCEYTGGGC